MNFKFIVSKNQKRYDLIINANSEFEARDRVHREGYSILSVEEVTNLNILGNKFLFTIIKDQETKNGVIYGEDIFKAYLKLKKEFGYDVVTLFAEEDKDKPEEYKKEVLKRVEEEYFLFSNKNKKQDDEILDQAKKQHVKENILEQDFYLKKELEEVYKLTDFVLKKLQNLINSAYFDISTEQKEKLTFILNSLISIKNSRNINKLREILELALIKIGKLELEYLEKTKDKKIGLLLKETNTLLKNTGSKTQIIEKNKDIGYILSQKLLVIKKIINDYKKDDSYKEDKETHSYIKTMVLLKKYQEKKQEVDKEYKKNMYFLFGNKDKKEALDIRRTVINQNISILEAKLKGRILSYTKIIKGYRILEEMFLNIIKYILSHITVIVIVFCFIFLIFINLSYYSLFPVDISSDGLLIFIYFILLFLFLNLARGFSSFIFYFVFFIFLNIFFTVNF
ncbi:hypothetical protein EOM39_00610 [Candidatus Gracilibacteria bacterium]|nr:hypothetical protein [Candidatus Gracilibacteria bacterium]